MSKKLLSSDKKKSSERNAEFYFYKLLNFVLPLALLALVRFGLVELAILLALFSKWRVFAVRPRHMVANLRTNSVDIIVKLSTLAFMVEADTLTEQSIWTAWYIVWLTVIKPSSSKSLVTFQAFAAQSLGISAVLLFSNNVNIALILIAIWYISLVSARHFIGSYEESKIQLMSHLWALFVLQMGWILSNWLLVYIFVPQLFFIVTVLSYALGSIYDAAKREELKVSFVRQQTAMTIAILILIILVADWQGNV